MRQTKAPASLRSKPARLEEIGAAVEVRRHPGARRLTLRVSRTRRAVIVTLPVQCDLDEAGSFLNRNIDWVRERLDSLPVTIPFMDGATMPLRGEPHAIVFIDTDGPASIVREAPPRESGTLFPHSLMSSFPRLVIKAPLADAPGLLRDWLFAEAKRDLAERVAIHEKKLKLKSKRIAVRDQTSRWGSCSTTGVLSFSWRLVLAPPHILDYVAAHEVAHLAEMNHGPRFWTLVASAAPDMDAAKRWLQVYGMDLHRYAPAGYRGA